MIYDGSFVTDYCAFYQLSINYIFLAYPLLLIALLVSFQESVAIVDKSRQKQVTEAIGDRDRKKNFKVRFLLLDYTKSMHREMVGYHSIR